MSRHQKDSAHIRVPHDFSIQTKLVGMSMLICLVVSILDWCLHWGQLPLLYIVCRELKVSQSFQNWPLTIWHHTNKSHLIFIGSDQGLAVTLVTGCCCCDTCYQQSKFLPAVFGWWQMTYSQCACVCHKSACSKLTIAQSFTLDPLLSDLIQLHLWTPLLLMAQGDLCVRGKHFYWP